jgi:hypothetical protein
MVSRLEGATGVSNLALHGAGDRSRTRDILITSEALYQLSYTGEAAGKSLDPRGRRNRR